MISIRDIISITDDEVDRLNNAGIYTVRHLLYAGAMPEGRMRLADQAHLSGERVAVLVHCADLLRIDGIGPLYAQLVYEFGITTVPKLAYRRVRELYEGLSTYNTASHLVDRTPTLEEVESWVVRAKHLPKIIRH